MSLGELTTQFTPAPSCLASSNLWVIRTISSAIAHEYYFFGRPLDAAQGCFPGGYNPASISYYSPAICPSGYTVASATSKVTAGTVTETSEVCCPTGLYFTAQTQDNTNTAHPFLTTLLCENTIRTPFNAVVTSTATGQASSQVTSTLLRGAINAYAVLVRRNNFDKISQTATSTPNNASNIPSSSRISSSAATTSGGATSGQNSTNPSSALGTGASIGIGISLGILAIGSVIAIVFLLLRRRKRNKETVAMMRHVDAVKAEGFSPAPSMQYRHEDGFASHELDGTIMRVEKDASDCPSELHGSPELGIRYPPPSELPAASINDLV